MSRALKVKALMSALILTVSIHAADVPAETIAKTLKSNVLKFNKQYAGKIIAIKGQVGIVKQSEEYFALILDYPGEGIGDPSIWCLINHDSLEKASSLAEKSKVRITGLVELMDSTMGGKIIALKNCSID